MHHPTPASAPATRTPPQDGAPRSPVFTLDNGGSESLRVVPASKRLSFLQFGSVAAGSERLGATINLHFEGNWMPVVVRGAGRGVELLSRAAVAFTAVCQGLVAPV